METRVFVAVEVGRVHGLVFPRPEARGPPLTWCPSFSPGSPLSQVAARFHVAGWFPLGGFCTILVPNFKTCWRFYEAMMERGVGEARRAAHGTVKPAARAEAPCVLALALWQRPRLPSVALEDSAWPCGRL